MNLILSKEPSTKKYKNQNFKQAGSKLELKSLVLVWILDRSACDAFIVCIPVLINVSEKETKINIRWIKFDR